MPSTTPTGPRPLLAGNWKMNGTRAALAEVAAVRDAVSSGRLADLDLLLCPPFTLLMLAADLCAGSALAIGGQDCDPAPAGASTGDIAAEMLRDAGARAVLVGHSERRQLHGETDAVVRSKAEAAARAGLSAIVCVGETRAEREAGDTLEVVGRQIDGSVPSGAAGIAVAYEPIWAIGTGVTPSPDDIALVHGFLRGRLGTGNSVRLLYGGSVNPANAAEVWAVEGVDGLLVGGASLKAREFLDIAAAR